MSDFAILIAGDVVLYLLNNIKYIPSNHILITVRVSQLVQSHYELFFSFPVFATNAAGVASRTRVVSTRNVLGEPIFTSRAAHVR
jgi:hypothetical protein